METSKVVEEITKITGLPFLRESSNEVVRELLFDLGVNSRNSYDGITGCILDTLHEKYRGFGEKLKHIPGYRDIATGRNCTDKTYTFSVYLDPEDK